MSRMGDMFSVVLADKSTVSVGDVANTFCTIMLIGERELDSVSNVKRKLTTGEWNAFVNAISSSFLTSVYINAAKTDEERARRVKEVSESAGMLLKGVHEA